MTDPRVERLARLLVGYSLDLREGHVVRIDGFDVAAPLTLALFRAALAAGAHPYAQVALEGLQEQLLRHGSPDQLEFVSPTQELEGETLDALVTIWSEPNTRSLSRVAPARQSRHLAARRRLRTRRWERIAAGELRWCGTLFPTEAHAQDAGMALADYEDFVFLACHCDHEDPAADWRARAAELADRARELEGVRELRFVGPDTDLVVGVAGRRWVASDGRHNMPDGEVFTSPVETATEGEIRFSFPATFEGREVDDVRLRFRHGRVVEAEAASGQDELRALLDTDEGARMLGEVAFGLNYEIDRFTGNTLFDEKIGGTVHVALGAAFPQTGGRVESALHWDLVCDLRRAGEVYADGELVWRDGRFLGVPAAGVAGA